MNEDKYKNELKDATPDKAILVAEKFIKECKQHDDSKDIVDDEVLLLLIERVGTTYEEKLTEKLLKLTKQDKNMKLIFSSKEFIDKYLEKVSLDNIDKIKNLFIKYKFIEERDIADDYFYVQSLEVKETDKDDVSSGFAGKIFEIIATIGFGIGALLKKIIQFILKLFGINKEEQSDMDLKKKKPTNEEVLKHTISLDSRFEEFDLNTEEIEGPEKKNDDMGIGE